MKSRFWLVGGLVFSVLGIIAIIFAYQQLILDPYEVAPRVDRPNRTTIVVGITGIEGVSTSLEKRISLVGSFLANDGTTKSYFGTTQSDADGFFALFAVPPADPKKFLHEDDTYTVVLDITDDTTEQTVTAQRTVRIVSEEGLPADTYSGFWQRLDGRFRQPLDENLLLDKSPETDLVLLQPGS